MILEQPETLRHKVPIRMLVHFEVFGELFNPLLQDLSRRFSTAWSPAFQTHRRQGAREREAL